jgi:hypothetical protein
VDVHTDCGSNLFDDGNNRCSCLQGSLQTIMYLQISRMATLFIASQIDQVLALDSIYSSFEHPKKHNRNLIFYPRLHKPARSSMMHLRHKFASEKSIKWNAQFHNTDPMTVHNSAPSCTDIFPQVNKKTPY